MFSHRKNSVPSPSIDDSYFGFPPGIPPPPPPLLPGGGGLEGGGRGDLEPDLILAAELGQALLEKNEELAAGLEEKEKELEVRSLGLSEEEERRRRRRRGGAGGKRSEGSVKLSEE